MPQTIINLVNAMYSNQPQHESDDRLDAARALLGVSPNSVADSSALFAARASKVQETSGESSTYTSDESYRRIRSDSVGLEALAFLATKEHASMETSSASALWEATSSEVANNMPLVASAVSSSSSSSDDETMPPPPPRRGITRRRSVSNPEGMEKWAPRDQNRLRFVLPASILEEELAEASAAMRAKQELEEEDEEADDYSPKEDEEDEESLSQDELLRRARSRLLEDLSEVNLNGEKGILTLPHTLDKYKEVRIPNPNRSDFA